MLEGYDQLEGSRGNSRVLLRREGLYRSHIEYWRAARDKGALTALSDKPAGRPSRSQAEVDNERLRKKNEKPRIGAGPDQSSAGGSGKSTRLCR